MSLKTILLTAVMASVGATQVAQADQMTSGVMAKHDQMVHETMQPYTIAAFEAAQTAGKPILVDIYASWCPVCKSQESTLKSLAEDKGYADVVMLRVNYDTQKDVLKILNVKSQSTLLTFKGKTETGRISFKSDPEVIKAFVAKLKS